MSEQIAAEGNVLDGKLLTLKQAQQLFPGNSKPSLRLLAAEARRLKCGRRFGRNFYIFAIALDCLIRGEEWLDFEKSRSKTASGSTTGAGSSPSRRRTARQSTDELSEALALATTQRPKRLAVASRQNSTPLPTPTVPFPNGTK